MAIIGHTRGNDAPLAQLAIEHFERDDAILIRYPNGIGYWSDADGRYYKNTPELTPIKCVIEPISSLSDRQLLHEQGIEHIEGHVVVWYQGGLFTSDSRGSDDHEGFSDVIEYKGEKWKVIQARRRTEAAFFTRAICALWEDLEGEQDSTSGNVV